MANSTNNEYPRCPHVSCILEKTMQAVTLVTTSLKYSFKTRSLLKHSSNTLMRKTKNYTTEA